MLYWFGEKIEFYGGVVEVLPGKISTHELSDWIRLPFGTAKRTGLETLARGISLYRTNISNYHITMYLSNMGYHRVMDV